MSPLAASVATVALLGSALIAGVFFAFSSFVMKALARLPAAQAIAAMQSINIVVINPAFLGVFMGSALLSLIAVWFALDHWPHPAASWLLSAGITYLVGTFLVTVLRNVPLNDRLAALCATEHASGEAWQGYLARWTAWNHVRTLAALASVLLYALGLARTGGLSP